MTPPSLRRGSWVPHLALAGLALLPMAGSLANGFAWDDSFIIESNPRVQSGAVMESLSSPYWPDAFTFAGSGLYRPIASAAFAAQWLLFDGSPMGYHAVALILHALVTLLIFTVLATLVSRGAAFVGAAIFAVHPIHVEAVANVVGQAELWAGVFTLMGVVAWRSWMDREGPWSRAALSVGVVVCYLLAIGSKEIGVTMPALALACMWAEGKPFVRSTPLIALCGAALVAYLGVRMEVVGTLSGEIPAPELMGLSASNRVLTSLSLWVDYVRLLVWPANLSADYGPAIRFPARGVDALVLAGFVVVVGLLAVAVLKRRTRPALSLGIVWFAIAVLPVSNLFFKAGVLLAERTLYLPSIGFAVGVAALVESRLDSTQWRSWCGAVAVAVLALAGRSALRVPVWQDTDHVLASLAREHPASHIVQRQVALRAMERGDHREARAAFGRALALVPRHFSLLTEVAQFEAVAGAPERAVDFAQRAVEIYPTSPHGYAVLARVHRIGGDFVAAQLAAADGLRRADPMAPIWRELERAREAEGLGSTDQD